MLARPDHLGDVLLTLPAAAALRRALPDAYLAYLVSPAMAEVVRHCPHVDEVLTVDFPAPNAPADPPGWGAVVASEAGSLAGRFDVGLVPRADDPWSGRLLHAAEIPLRLGFDLPRTRPFLTHALPEDRRSHVVSLTLALAGATVAIFDGAAARDLDPGGPCFIPTGSEEAEAGSMLRRASHDGVVLLHPGSAWPLKNWPAERWGRLAAGLRQRLGVSPFVLGGTGEDALVDAVVAASAGAATPLPPAPVGVLAAIQARARLVIATDSGPMHLAALSGAPVVGLFGPAEPALFAPWAPAERSCVVRVELPCSPCGTLEKPPCGALVEPACIMGIGVEAVLSAAGRLLAQPAHA